MVNINVVDVEKLKISNTIINFKLEIMKTKLIIALLTATNTFAQWTYKTVDNKFDEPFKKAINLDYKTAGMMILEKSDYNFELGFNVPFFAVKGTYFCEEYPYVDFVFFVGGVKYNYSFVGATSTDKEYIFFNDEIWTAEFIRDFKSASKVLVRVNQSYCDNDYYEFNFSGSTAAFNFIIK